ncbi:MAG: HpcH/HpaI aldolase/citrate lyase family protein [Alphaproteobacteria bacterium]
MTSRPSRPIRPRRSVLYMPGSNARALEKAKGLPADALILDLEDAVAPDAKETARDQVCAAVAGGGYGYRELIIRINGLETEWGTADLEAAVKARPDGILVPKIDGPEAVGAADTLMAQAGAGPELAMWAMMETPLAMLRAEAIAARARDTRLAAFVMGTNDLVKDLGALQTPDRLPLVTGLSLTLLAGKAYGLALIDGVHNGIQDQDGFIEVCRQGLAFGFDGKTLIHPSQVQPCNQVFTPETQAVDWARTIIAEFEKPENAAKGVVQVEGRMVERLHAEQARRLVDLAEAIETMEAAV